MKLYELVGQDRSQGFSPYVWRIRMALAHKGFAPERVPLTFTEIPDKLAFANAKTVPVLEDGDQVVVDSWNIACYLEDTYPHQPSLFGGDTGRTLARHFNMSSIYHLMLPLFRAIVADIFEVIDEKDQDYFRQSRESRLGQTLEEMRARKPENLNIFRTNLWPYNATLKEYAFLAGDKPAYVDYILYGIFQWARYCSPDPLLEEENPLYSWLERMDELFDGLGQTLKRRT